jgi:protein arginine N-methyltransferase 1
MYSLSEYRLMVADRIRTDAYAAALRRVVTADSVVVDIGAGTGIFALLACRYGARRVYAIEPDDAIEIGHALAAANGFAGRITFIQDLSTRVTLPERADVIVSDLRGVLPPKGQHIPSIVDARRRFLSPGGILIPQRDILWAAPVEAPQVYAQSIAPWDHDAHGIDAGSARRFAVNTWSKARVRPDQLLGSPQRVATLDYTVVEDPDVDVELAWTMSRPGTGHGLIVWFDAVLLEGVGFSTAPSEPELVYGAGFFPWAEPVALEEGDALTAGVRADLTGEEYVWRWNTVIRTPDGREKARFAQSNFQGTPMPLERIRTRAATYVPSLAHTGRIDLAILNLMDGRRSVGEIARLISERFADVFPSPQDALVRVADLSQRYGK